MYPASVILIDGVLFFTEDRRAAKRKPDADVKDETGAPSKFLVPEIVLSLSVHIRHSRSAVRNSIIRVCFSCEEAYADGRATGARRVDDLLVQVEEGTRGVGMEPVR